ncbi:hypothetical protein ACIBF6_37530 [Streptosporangium amethystogenes]|uniref:hypothetical protein n=1 Tax=Streptosporangium amethystogenes TaxID=2002 RepID=UPI0037BABE99
MAGKRLVPTVLTVTVGAVLAFGISTAASAATSTTVTGLSAPAVQPVPYPPRPAEQVNMIHQDQQQGNNIRLENRRRHHHRNCERGCRNCGRNCGGGGCKRGCRPSAVAEKQLPFTGAPMGAMAALGGGLLAMGATGTLISVRRRRSASAE